MYTVSHSALSRVSQDGEKQPPTLPRQMLGPRLQSISCLTWSTKEHGALFMGSKTSKRTLPDWALSKEGNVMFLFRPSN